MMKMMIPLALAFSVLNLPTVAMAADCNAVASRTASQQDAQVISARLKDSGGQQVCEIVLLKASGDGPRKRVTVTVPAA
ncbi:MAG: hypothetical protein AAFY73_10170 [Pseudomonadota bacterium]